MLRCAIHADQPASLMPVVHALASGGVVVMPTDTIYGLSGRYDRPSALRRIAAAKGRGAATPFLLLIGAREQLALLAAEAPPAAALDLLWPGPVTAVLPARPGLAPPLAGGRGTVAVRQPGAALVRALVDGTGVPLVSTSINRAGEMPLLEPDAIARAFGAAIDVLADAGPPADTVPSTLVDLTVRPPVILRQGRRRIDLVALARCLG